MTQIFTTKKAGPGGELCGHLHIDFDEVEQEFFGDLAEGYNYLSPNKIRITEDGVITWGNSIEELKNSFHKFSMMVRARIYRLRLKNDQLHVD